MKTERIFYSLIIATLGILLLLERCKHPKPCPEENTPVISKTVETIDTTTEVSQFDTSYKPTPKKIYANIDPVKSFDEKSEGEGYYIGSEGIYSFPGNISIMSFPPGMGMDLKLALDNPVMSEYSDTIITPSGDSVIINDTIHHNKIQGRKIDIRTKQITIERSRETVFIPQQRNKFFFAFNVYGNKKDIINGFSGGIMLKTKKEKYYEVGSFITRGLEVTGYAGIKLPIKIGKH